MASKAETIPIEREDEHGPMRLMSYAEGYVMVRRKNCAPVSMPLDDWVAIGAAPDAPPPVVQKPELVLMVELWNKLAAKHGLSKVQKLTAARKSKAIKRLKDCGGLAGWQAALQKVDNIPGLLGKSGGTWKANFDFMLQESSFTKLMEGQYDKWGTQGLNNKQSQGDRQGSFVTAASRFAGRTQRTEDSNGVHSDRMGAADQDSFGDF